MSVGGQSNAPQTPFSPNYRERRSVQPRGPGNAYTQRPGQQPNPQQPAQLQPAPQPNQGGQGYGNPFGGGFGGGYSSPFGGGFGGGYSTPFSDYGGGFGGGYGQPRQYGGGFGQPNQPPPGMELNPDYIEPRTGGVDTMEQRPSRFRPIQQPQPQTGGDIQYAGGSPGFYEAQLQAQQRQGGQGYGNQFGGGYGGGYSSPYMSSPMMGGLASLFGGMQGGGFQGMFNPQSQAQAQMRAYQQNQQRNFNQPPPGMVKNPNYDASYAMQDNVDAPGTPGYMKRQQFIPSSLTEIRPQFGGVNRQDEGENSFEKLMATLPSEERAKYHGTSEHRNSANTLETIRRTRQDPEWGRYYQNKSDDEIYAGMQLRAI